MSTSEKEEDVNGITDLIVINYLKKHHDFFYKNPDILSEIEIPHERGIAVSLVEKQISVLRKQNKEAEQRLEELIKIARQNEELARRMHKLALTLMDVSEIEDLFNTLYNNIKNNFNADLVVVKLFADPVNNVFDLTKEFVGKSIPEQAVFKELIEKRLPFSGGIENKHLNFLFGSEGMDVGSSVVIPLHGKNWGGLLAIGSFDETRFHEGMGVELLANLGEILSFILKPWVLE